MSNASSIDALKQQLNSNKKQIEFQNNNNTRFLDTDTQQNAQFLCDDFSAYLHRFSNEPSVGLYRVSEHIRKTVPNVQSKKFELNGKQKQLQEQTYDVEYALNYLQEVNKSLSFFQNIKESLQNSLVNITNFHKKQQEAFYLKQQEEQKLLEQQQLEQQEKSVNIEPTISQDSEHEAISSTVPEESPITTSSQPSIPPSETIPLAPSNEFQEVEPTIVEATSSKKKKKKKNQVATLEDSTEDDSMKPKEF